MGFELNYIACICNSVFSLQKDVPGEIDFSALSAYHPPSNNGAWMVSTLPICLGAFSLVWQEESNPRTVKGSQSFLNLLTHWNVFCHRWWWFHFQRGEEWKAGENSVQESCADSSFKLQRATKYTEIRRKLPCRSKAPVGEKYLHMEIFTMMGTI